MTAIKTSAYAIPEPCMLSKADISSFAEEIAEAVGLRPGGNLLSVIETIGGEVSYSDSLESIEAGGSGSIYMSKSGFEIVLPWHTGPLRDRFTIAHELGHFFLHYLGTDSDGDERTMVADRFGSGRVETEANWFAASFLMPKDCFVDLWEATDGDVRQVAAEFNVSTSAASVRAQSLGLS